MRVNNLTRKSAQSTNLQVLTYIFIILNVSLKF